MGLLLLQISIKYVFPQENWKYLGARIKEKYSTSKCMNKDIRTIKNFYHYVTKSIINVFRKNWNTWAIGIFTEKAFSIAFQSVFYCSKTWNRKWKNRKEDSKHHVEKENKKDGIN